MPCNHTCSNGFYELKVADPQLLRRATNFLVLGLFVDLVRGESDGIAFVAFDKMPLLLPPVLIDRMIGDVTAVASK